MSRTVPTVADVSELLARNVEIPRIILVRLTRTHPTTAAVKLYHWGTAPYRNRPTDTTVRNWLPLLSESVTFDWSRFDGGNLSGRIETNRGLIRVINSQHALDELVTDEYEMTKAEVWYATTPEFGLSWGSLEALPRLVVDAVEPPLPGNRSMAIRIEGIESRVAKLEAQSRKWLGLGQCLEFAAGGNDVGEIAHDADLVPTSRLEVAAIWRFSASGTTQTLITKGKIFTGPFALTRESDGRVRFRIYDGSSSAQITTTGAISNDVITSIRGVWDRPGDELQIWVDGALVQSGSAGGLTPDATNTDPVRVGGDTTAGRQVSGWVSHVEMWVDIARDDADVEAQRAVAELPADAVPAPTAYLPINEGFGSAYSRLAPDGETIWEMVLSGSPGPSWASTETGDAQLAGKPLPLTLGSPSRARMVLSNAKRREYHVNGGNGESGDRNAVLGIGPVDEGGLPVPINHAEPWVSTMFTTSANTLVSTDPLVDFEGLLEGQDVVIDATVLERRTLKADAERSRLVFTTAAPTLPAKPIAVSVAGDSQQSSGLQFVAARNTFAASDIETSKYFGYSLPVTFAGWAQGANNATFNVTVAGPNSFVVDGAPVDEPAGRVIQITRTITYGANQLQWIHHTSGITFYTTLATPGDGSVAPLSGLKAMPTGDPERTKIVVTGSGLAGNNGTYRVIAGGLAPRVEPNSTTAGLDPGTGIPASVTVTVTEYTTLASIDSAPAKIVSHDDSVSFLSRPVGAEFEVSGSGSNDGTLTVLSAPTASELPVVEAVTDEAAGAAVSLEWGAEASTALTVWRSKGMLQAHYDFVFPLSTAVRGCIAGGAFASSGAEVARQLLVEHWGFTESDLDMASLTSWGSADPYPRQLQVVEPANAAELLGALVQPGASWGSLKGNKLVFAPMPIPEDVAPSLEVFDHHIFANEGQPTEIPARSRPVLGRRNYVVLSDDQIAGEVKLNSPDKVPALKEMWATSDPGGDHEGETQDDEALESTYATTAGIAAAAVREARMWGVPRKAWALTVSPLILDFDWMAASATVTDSDDPELKSGRRLVLVSLEIGASRLAYRTRWIG